MHRGRKLEDYSDEFRTASAVMVDTDGAMVDGIVAAGVGAYYLKQEIKRGHAIESLIGILGGVPAYVCGQLSCFYLGQRMGLEELGFRSFQTALNLAGCVDEDTTERFAQRYIEKHARDTDDIRRMMALFKQYRDIKLIAYTGGLEEAARAAKNHFGFDEYFGTHKVRGNKIGPRYHEVRGKRDIAERYLQETGVDIGDCIVIEDSGSGVPLFEPALLSIAAPSANEHVKNSADIWIPSYAELSSFLRKL